MAARKGRTAPGGNSSGTAERDGASSDARVPWGVRVDTPRWQADGWLGRLSFETLVLMVRDDDRPLSGYLLGELRRHLMATQREARGGVWAHNPRVLGQEVDDELRLFGRPLDADGPDAVEGNQARHRRLHGEAVHWVLDMLEGPCLYDPGYKARFEGIALSKETRALIRSKPQGEELVLLNKRILEEAYPEVMSHGKRFRFGYGDAVYETTQFMMSQMDERWPAWGEQMVLERLLRSTPPVMERLRRVHGLRATGDPLDESLMWSHGRRVLIQQVLNIAPDDRRRVPDELRQVLVDLQGLARALVDRQQYPLSTELVETMGRALPFQFRAQEIVHVGQERWVKGATYIELPEGGRRRPPYFDAPLIAAAHFIKGVMDSGDDRDPETGYALGKCDWCGGLFLRERGARRKYCWSNGDTNCRKRASDDKRQEETPPKDGAASLGGLEMDSPFLYRG